MMLEDTVSTVNNCFSNDLATSTGRLHSVDVIPDSGPIGETLA